MLSEKEINNIYEQYKKDLNFGFLTSRLVISQLECSDDSAQIGSVNLETAELLLGEIFYNNGVSNKYLHQMLYHEFTHITDRLSFFTNIDDERKRRNLLFPYTEFHATRIELCKKLELFYNPQKKIGNTTRIYDIYGLTTLKNFLDDCNKELQLRVDILENNLDFKNVQFLVYTMIYNLGYHSICEKFNIQNNLFDTSLYTYIATEMNELKELLMNTKPSDELCKTTNEIVNDITFKICKKYNIDIK